MTVTGEPGQCESGRPYHGPPTTVTVTCCLDKHAHEVLDVELAAAASRPDGLVHAICGHVIAAAPMVAPDGPPCALCSAVMDVRQAGSRRTG
ncbi:hypothetical protein [Pseudonocardia zijingensis]|uniref:Uncharacterized protein n=1 Tax=Pseudonocardia zijingensis TaxID=153376 RepID=A0ABP3YR89_9PSEU